MPNRKSPVPASDLLTYHETNQDLCTSVDDRLKRSTFYIVSTLSVICLFCPSPLSLEDEKYRCWICVNQCQWLNWLVGLSLHFQGCPHFLHNAGIKRSVFHIWQFCKCYSLSCSEPQCLLNLQRGKTKCVSTACVLNCNSSNGD